MKVLVVDDERDIPLLFQQRFRKEIQEGYLEFVFVYSAEEALAYLEQLGCTHVVLILSDINMPGMSGLELLSQIKARWANMPVLMITAYGDEDTYSKALALGADGYLDKPLNFNVLKQEMMAKYFSRECGSE
jgi:CheY-like chemotaxis protein